MPIGPLGIGALGIARPAQTGGSIAGVRSQQRRESEARINLAQQQGRKAIEDSIRAEQKFQFEIENLEKEDTRAQLTQDYELAIGAVGGLLARPDKPEIYRAWYERIGQMPELSKRRGMWLHPDIVDNMDKKGRESYYYDIAKGSGSSLEKLWAQKAKTSTDEITLYGTGDNEGLTKKVYPKKVTGKEYVPPSGWTIDAPDKDAIPYEDNKAKLIDDNRGHYTLKMKALMDEDGYVQEQHRDEYNGLLKDLEADAVRIGKGQIPSWLKGKKEGPPPEYKTAEDVKAAYKIGKITKEKARALIKQYFWNNK